MSTLDTSARAPVMAGVLALVLLVAGLGLWSVLTKITGAVISPGTIEVESSRQIVQHPAGGVVVEIKARDGQHVAAGELLVRLDTSQQHRELAFAQAQMFELAARQARLHAERLQHDEVTFAPTLIAQGNKDLAKHAVLEGQRQLFRANRRSLDNEIAALGSRKDQISAQISGIKVQRAALIRQLELTGVALANHRALFERRLTPAASVLELEREEARLSGTMGELSANLASAQGQLVETDLEQIRILSAYVAQGVARARDLDAPLRKFKRDAHALRAEIALAEVRAPVAGVVYGMTLRTTKAVLRPAEPLLYLIPQDRPLIVAMRVQPRDVDKVAVGQAVKLRLSALDQSRTPEIWGQITQISADAIVDEKNGQTFYRVEIELPAAEIARLPADMALLPGMPVEGFIRTGNHSPFTYLVKPMADYFARALRES